jgi:hypothetical protein
MMGVVANLFTSSGSEARLAGISGFLEIEVV